jgi:hypothetical protein
MDIEAKAFLGHSDPAYYQRLVVLPNSRQLHIVTDGQEPGFDRGPMNKAWISPAR